MVLTRSFRDTVAARAQHDPAFRSALFQEALQALLDGDTDTAKTLLRDCINATVGFDALARLSGLPVKSLMRMVGPNGNPSIRNFATIVHLMQGQMQVRATASVAGASDLA